MTNFNTARSSVVSRMLSPKAVEGCGGGPFVEAKSSQHTTIYIRGAQGKR